MAKKSLIVKSQRTPKFSARRYFRCQRCGRVRAFIRKFHLCRICFRELAISVQIPGVTKASWYSTAHGGGRHELECSYFRHVDPDSQRFEREVV